MNSLIAYVPYTKDTLKSLPYGLICGGSIATRASATALSLVIDLKSLARFSKNTLLQIEGFTGPLDNTLKKITSLVVPLAIRVVAIWGAFQIGSAFLGMPAVSFWQPALAELIHIALVIDNEGGNRILSKTAKAIDTLIRSTL